MQYLQILIFHFFFNIVMSTGISSSLRHYCHVRWMRISICGTWGKYQFNSKTNRQRPTKVKSKNEKKAWKTWLAFIPKLSTSYYFDSSGIIFGALIKELWIVSESVVRRCSAKTWKVLQKSQEKHLSWSLLFRCAALSKRDSDTRLFLWILWIFFFRDHL